MCRVPRQTDHDWQVRGDARSVDRAFVEMVAEITQLTEQARRRGRPVGTTGIPRDGARTRQRLAQRVQRHGETSDRLMHAIELREQMERSREEKTRRHRVFLIGQAVHEQMAVNPALRTAILTLLDDYYVHDKARRDLGLRRLTAEEKRARKLGG